MAVRSREELHTELENLIGDTTSDAAIALIEDLTDTLTDLESRVKGDGTDWKAEAEKIDKQWREKYVKRFKSGGDDGDDEPTAPTPRREYTYENLFK